MFDKLNYFVDTKLPWFSFPDEITASAVIEIIILTILIYKFTGYIKDNKALLLFKGMIMIIIFFIISHIFDFYIFLWIFENLFQLLIIAIAVVFQPELRKILESLGKNKFKITSLFTKNYTEKYSDKSIDEIVKAVNIMSANKTGALILLEQENSLFDYEQTGIAINADISNQLLINIFEHNTPLHDGALIIKNDKITAATCYLPLSENRDVSKALGTRHRAAIGASEVTDALIIIVSEETGKISIAQNGELKHGITEKELIEILEISQQKKEKETFLSKLITNIKKEDNK